MTGYICSSEGCTEMVKTRQKTYGPESHTVSDKTSEKLREAIHEELREIINEGISIPTLNTLQRFADVARELLMVRSPLAQVKQRKRARIVGTINPQFAAAGYQDMYGHEDGCVPEPLADEASTNETYGAKLVRELIPALSKIGEDKQDNAITELVTAIAMAKEKGLDDVVKTLNAKLEDLLFRGYLESPDRELMKAVASRPSQTPKSESEPPKIDAGIGGAKDDGIHIDAGVGRAKDDSLQISTEPANLHTQDSGAI